MQSFDRFDWSSGSEAEHLAMVRRGNEAQLRALARRYDWSLHPERVLGWIMARKCVDLGTALTVFLNGDPERFNYMPKRDVPDAYRGVARVLDNICLRVNSGFYLVRPGRDVADRPRLENWLTCQEFDRDEGKRGRWILDERIVAALPGSAPAPARESVDRDTLRRGRGRTWLHAALGNGRAHTGPKAD